MPKSPESAESAGSEKSEPRFFGLDGHHDYVVVAAVNRDQHVRLEPRRFTHAEWQRWAEANLKETDEIVLEATGNAWDMHDFLVPLAGQVVVAHAGKVRPIAEARVKTDGHDARTLAKLLAANMIPAVWVPPVPVRELRALIAHRRGLVQQHVRLKNRLHSLLNRHNLQPPDGDPFLPAKRAFWHTVGLSPTERLLCADDLTTLDHVATRLDAIDQELARLSVSEPWVTPMRLLIQLPGVGLIVAMTILAAIGDIGRFDTPRQLVGYAGLGARVHLSGQQHRNGSITKSGRRDLRWALVEAARNAAQSDPYCKAHFERWTQRLCPNKAYVALAHKLAIMIWHILTAAQPYRHADDAHIARKMLLWGWAVKTAEARGQMSNRQFIRYQLMHLGVGNQLETVQLGRNPEQRYRIAPASELVKLKPELLNLTT